MNSWAKFTCLLLLVAPLSASANEIVLKDGTTIKAQSIKSATPEKVRFRVGGSSQTRRSELTSRKTASALPTSLSSMCGRAFATPCWLRSKANNAVEYSRSSSSPPKSKSSSTSDLPSQMQTTPTTSLRDSDFLPLAARTLNQVGLTSHNDTASLARCIESR